MKYLVLLVPLFLAACSGSKVYEQEIPQDKDGDGVQDTVLGIPQWQKIQTSESALVAKELAVKDWSQIQDEGNGCPALTAEQVQGLSAAGQDAYFTQMLVCNVTAGIADAVKASHGLPTTAAGEVAYTQFKTIAAIENSDAEEARSKNQLFGVGLSTLGWIGGAYVLGNAISDVSENSGISFGDDATISQSNSNSGTAGGGAGQVGDATQQRALASSVFGDVQLGQMGDNPVRSGFGFDGGQPLINDVSGTQNQNSGQQKSSPIADELNGGFNNSDDDSGSLL